MELASQVARLQGSRFGHQGAPSAFLAKRAARSASDKNRNACGGHGESKRTVAFTQPRGAWARRMARSATSCRIESRISPRAR